MKIFIVMPLILLASLVPACTIIPPTASTVTSPTINPPETPINAINSTGTLSIPASSPVKVSLSISKLPVLNEPFTLTCNLTSLGDFENVSVNITSARRLTSPDSYFMPFPYVVSNNISRSFDIAANQTISFSVQITLDEIGKWELAAKTSGDIDIIYLTVNNDSSYLGWPSSQPQPVRIDKYGQIMADLELSQAPKLNEPAKLFITIVCPFDFPGLSAHILISPKTAVITDNSTELIVSYLVPGANQYSVEMPGVDLKAGVPFHCSATVVFQDVGVYHVTADAEQKIGNVSHVSNQDTIYLKIGTNESAIEQDPSTQTNPSNSPLPPPPTDMLKQ